MHIARQFLPAVVFSVLIARIAWAPRDSKGPCACHRGSPANSSGTERRRYSKDRGDDRREVGGWGLKADIRRVVLLSR
jgi:hypothetical protein